MTGVLWMTNRRHSYSQEDESMQADSSEENLNPTLAPG